MIKIMSMAKINAMTSTIFLASNSTPDRSETIMPINNVETLTMGIMAIKAIADNPMLATLVT